VWVDWPRHDQSTREIHQLNPSVKLGITALAKQSILTARLCLWVPSQEYACTERDAKCPSVHRSRREPDYYRISNGFASARSQNTSTPLQSEEWKSSRFCLQVLYHVKGFPLMLSVICGLHISCGPCIWATTSRSSWTYRHHPSVLGPVGLPVDCTICGPSYEGRRKFLHPCIKVDMKEKRAGAIHINFSYIACFDFCYRL
jgi:hypothetical protein